ncbi:MAG: hypothetical protein Q9165_002012 [Trypethelium subeluteriae]
MPSSEYSSVGGALRLKGSKPVGVEKKRKKKKASATVTSEEKKSALENVADDNAKSRADGEDDNDSIVRGEDIVSERREEDDAGSQPLVKTKAEREQEERRRRRLEERLKREGVKTHKERVEELNKYLSNLSEHHDMYAPIVFTTFPVSPNKKSQAKDWTRIIHGIVQDLARVLCVFCIQTL